MTAGRRLRCEAVRYATILAVCKEYDRMSTKRTYQPKSRRRSRVHGFFARMSTPGGQNVIKARRLRGRKRLSA